MKKKLLSSLLLGVLLLTLLPPGAMAEEPPAEPEPPVVTEAPPAVTEPPAETEPPQEPEPTKEPEPTEEPEPKEPETPAAAPAAPAAAAAQTPAAGEETENSWGVRADDVIWLGFYDEVPIPWLVLDAKQTNMETEGMFLLSRARQRARWCPPPASMKIRSISMPWPGGPWICRRSRCISCRWWSCSSTSAASA